MAQTRRWRLTAVVIKSMFLGQTDLAAVSSSGHCI